MSAAKKVPLLERESTKAKDESRDHIYYTVTPRLVWALSEDPFDLALWVVIKDIAGENGTCILAREDLAALAMMSAGQVSISRERLLERKLLKGELRRDPGYPQDVWHLSIPDFWEANVRWARMYPTIKARVEFKKSQKIARKLQREAEKKEKDPSLHDASRDPSLHDGGVSPSDGGVSPSDTKNNVLEKPKEEVREEELKDLFLKVAKTVFSDTKELSLLRDVSEELELSRIELVDRTFIVSGLPSDRPAYYQDHYKRSFERAFVGLLREEVSIEFVTGTNAS